MRAAGHRAVAVDTAGALRHRAIRTGKGDRGEAALDLGLHQFLGLLDQFVGLGEQIADVGIRLGSYLFIGGPRGGDDLGSGRGRRRGAVFGGLVSRLVRDISGTTCLGVGVCDRLFCGVVRGLDLSFDVGKLPLQHTEILADVFQMRLDLVTGVGDLLDVRLCLKLTFTYDESLVMLLVWP
jgi:hypothetical protein